MPQPHVTAGRPQPFGATPDAEGVNFSVYSEFAKEVELLLFPDDKATEPDVVIRLDPSTNRSFNFWHCHVRGLKPGQLYGYRADGPSDTIATGHRFDGGKALIDPYALGNVTTLWERGTAVGPGDNVATAMRSVVIDPGGYDWEGDRPLNTPLADTVIYEQHVRGFTRSPTAGCRRPGTFAGVVEKIPYLKQLGVTAIELLPIFDFDEQDILRVAPDGTPLRNYWGYDPIGFFAPHSAFCTAPEQGSHLDEFRDMVKALHKAGIEVILDVVFNHTSEGNENGPTISFRGLANEAYYHLVPQDKRYYMNYSGTGNAINANHPVTAKLIIESLEYWVTEHHVDGFRFDLGSVLARGTDGAEMAVPPVLWNIELSRVLSETKIIAEAWDAGGLYQVGRFPGERWCEWNGKYRDDVRRFVRGEPGVVGALASRIAGSADLFQERGELPTNSVNFVTAHDGFTLNDLVSYNDKHNEANGEGNADGSNDNLSWNCGVEGPTEDPEVERLRERQIRNAATILLVSRGVPMLLGGDETRRTQRGNNNGYCQDSDISWFDWDLTRQHAGMVRFFREMIALRMRFPALRRAAFFDGSVNERGVRDISWHGCALGQPGWSDPDCRVLAFTLAGFEREADLHVMLNAGDQGLDFELPVIDSRRWARVVDTGRPSPDDILAARKEEPVDGSTYHVQGRSSVILVSKASRRTK